MRKSKNKNKLVVAVSMMVISAIVLTSASYAWFQMNKQVSVNGLTMTAVAPTSLEVKVGSGEYGPTASMSESGITVYPFAPVSGNYVTPTLYYALKMDSAVPPLDTINESTEVFTLIPGQTDNKRQYYVDIPVSIKTDNLTAGTSVDLFVKSLNITGTLGDAFKVAILDGATLKGIYDNTLDDAWNPLSSETAVSSTAVSLAAEGITGTNIGTISGAGDGNAVNLTLRVWLEGQDSKCTYDNAASAGITIEFEGVDVPPAE